MSRNSMVAVCDVLGCSNYIKRNSLEEAISHIRSIKQAAEQSKLMGYTPEGDVRSFVGHVTFSDTVVFYSLEDNIRAFEHVLIAAFRILAIPMLNPNFRFRIGISYGEFYASKEEQIYVGKALVDAHELEKKQEWCGAAFTQVAFEQIERSTAAKFYVKKYNVPVKGNKTEEYHVIDWTLAQHEPIATERFLEREGSILISDAEPSIESKLINTDRFHFEVCRMCSSIRKLI